MAGQTTFTAKSFGRNLRRLRKERGHSQEGFALASGVDRSYVGGLERGDRNPALSMIIRLAEALDVPPRMLFEDGANCEAVGTASEAGPEPDAPPVPTPDRSP